MKVKFILLVFLLLSVVVVLATSKILNSPVDVSAKTVETAETNHTDTEPSNNLSKFTSVRSEQNSELIPDRVAYMMVFRLLSSHKNDAERKRLRGYVQQNLGITDENEIEAVFQLADDFKQRTLPVDNQINSIKERYHPTHSAFSNDDRKKLEKLKKDKEKIVDDLVTDIPRRLSENGKLKLHQNLQEHVKQKIKIRD